MNVAHGKVQPRSWPASDVHWCSDHCHLCPRTDLREAIRLYEAALAIVPFYAFGSPEDSSWYRLSVGTCNLTEADNVMNSLRSALLKLTSQ